MANIRHRCSLTGNSTRKSVIAIAMGSASILAILPAGTAFAQDSDASQQRGFGVEDIVVTAQKREQNVQDVPIAVTALSQDSIQANRVTSVNDLTGLAPGLVSRQNAGSLGSPSFSMRGVFASASSPSQDRETSIYIDGVYIGGTRGSAFDLPDTERIEVLRGPQGTLFGRNATAGAVNIVTREPVGELHWRQDVTVGNYDQLRTRTTVDSPQIGPFSAYLTFVHDERRGDVRNLGAGTAFTYGSPLYPLGTVRSPKWLGNKNSESFFGALKFEPSDRFKMVYKFDHSRGVNSPEARAPAVINPNSFVGGVLLGIIAAQPPGGGAFGPVVLNPSDRRPDATNNAWTQQGFQRSQGHSLTTSFEINDDLSLKNISAYRKAEVYGPSSILGVSGLEYTAAAKDFYTAPRAFLGGASYAQALGSFVDMPVGSYFAGYEGSSYGKNHQYSTETQLNYASDFLDLTVGALYYHAKELNGGLPGMAANFQFQPFASALPLGKVQDGTSIVTSLAAYAQGEFHVTPQLDIIVGGRITKDKKRGDLVTGGSIVDGELVSTPAAPIRNFPFTFKKTKPTFSLGVNYKPNDDILIYAKVSNAFLSGGAVGQITFEPETVISEEIGIKSEFLDRRLRVNVALWNADYKHMQTAISGSNVIIGGVSQSALGVVVIDNGPLKAKGVEFELTAVPIEGLTFGVSMGYTDTKLTRPSQALAQGRPYKGSGNPKWAGALNAQYETRPLFADASMLFRIDGNYQGKFRVIPFTDVATVQPVFAPYEFSPSRWIVNSRIALRDIKIGAGEFEVGLWSRNLFDNKAPLYTLPFGDIAINSSYQPARTYGVDFIAKF